MSSGTSHCEEYVRRSNSSTIESARRVSRNGPTGMMKSGFRTPGKSFSWNPGWDQSCPAFLTSASYSRLIVSTRSERSMTVKYNSRVTRAISLSASRQSGIRWSTWFVVATSNAPDTKGRRAASAKTTSRRPFARPNSTIFREMSTPTTRTPLFWIGAERNVPLRRNPEADLEAADHEHPPPTDVAGFLEALRVGVQVAIGKSQRVPHPCECPEAVSEQQG